MRASETRGTQTGNVAMDIETLSHSQIANHAQSFSGKAVAAFRQLEAAERQASAWWESARKAARDAGDTSAADQALERSRRHWENADRIAAMYAA